MTQPENKHQSERKYRAFISYRHASEGKLTKAVDLAMKRIGKPWLKTLLHLPGLRLYRDLSSQGLVGDLEAAVCQAMDESDFFILMASPGSLESPWIPKEIAYWLETRPDESPLIARCAGDLVWDDELGYDTPETDCLPDELRNHYTGQPLWLDFREASRSGKPTLKDPEFLRQIALATATVTRRPPEEVIGEEVTRHQRMVRGAVTISLVLAALSVSLFVAWQLASERLARTQWENGVLYRDVLNRSTEAAFWFASATDSPDKSLADSARLAAWHAVRGAEFVGSEAISDNSQQTDMGQTTDESALSVEDYYKIVVSREGEEPLEIGCDEGILPCDDEDIIGAELNPDGNRVVVWVAKFVHVLSLTGFEIEGLEGPVQLIDSFEHPGTIEGAIFSADGLETLSWDFEGRIFLRNTDARQTNQVFAHKAKVNGATFYADGEQILSWSEDGTLRSWSVDDPIAETTMSHGDDVLEARLTADESLVLSRGQDKTVRIWKTHNGQQAVPPLLHDAPVSDMIFTDNRNLTTYTDDRRWDWQVRPGAQLAWPGCDDNPVLCGSGIISGARFDANFERVLSWGSPGVPRVWNANTGEQELELLCSLDSDSRHCKGVEGGLWLDESSRILTWSSDSTLRLWKATDGSSLAGFPCIEKSEDGCQDKKVDGALYDSQNNRVVTWDRGNWVRVWNMEGSTELVSKWRHKDVAGAGFSPGGTWVASWRAHEEGDSEPTVMFQKVEDKSGNPDEAIPLLPDPLEESVSGVLFTNDDERLLAWGSEGGIRLWSQLSGKNPEVLTMSHSGRVNGAVFNREETRVLSWGRNGLVKIWDASSGIEQSSSTCEQSRESFCLSVPVGGAMFIRDEEIVAAYGEDNSGTINLWHANTGEPVLKESMSHGKPIIGIQDVADGKRIVSWGQNGSIIVWDTRTGDQAVPPLNHGVQEDKVLKGVLYDENNHRLLSYGGDERLRLWSIDYPSKICKQDLLKKISARTHSEVTTFGEWLSLGPDDEFDSTVDLPWWNVRGWFCQ